CSYHSHPRPLPSFPTRRSSDLTPKPGNQPVETIVASSLSVCRENPTTYLRARRDRPMQTSCTRVEGLQRGALQRRHVPPQSLSRSEEHTSELQSLRHLVCRLLL